MIDHKYDGPKIYAEQLRAIGVEISESVPDCAWAPAGSIHLDEVHTHNIGPGGVDFTMSVWMSEPFRWVEAEFVVTPPEMEEVVVHVSWTETSNYSASFKTTMPKGLSREEQREYLEDLEEGTWFALVQEGEIADEGVEHRELLDCCVTPVKRDTEPC